MTTGKKVLIGGAVVIGGYVIYKMFAAPTAPLLNKTPATNLNSGLLQGVGAFFSGLISGGNPKSGPNSYGPQPNQPGYSATVYSTTTGIDPNTGGVYLPPNQVYGPPVPPTLSSMSGPSGASNGGNVDGAGDSLLAPTSF